MDPYLQADNPPVRISSSPRRSPQITQGLTSPVRSVHPQMQQLDSLHSQPDFGLRTADFFDDSSDDETANAIDPSTVAPDVDLIERQGSAKKRRSSFQTERFYSRCESKPDGPAVDHEGYQRLGDTRVPDTASSSFHGSVDELLPNGNGIRPLRPSRASNTLNPRIPRSSAPVESTSNRQSMITPAKIDPTLGAYAVAHHITLDALMRDGDALDRSLQSFALSTLPAGDRRSLLPQSLDPRSPRGRAFSSPTVSKKAVHVVPPPIDTSVPRRSIPEDIIRTPYPFSPETIRRKNLEDIAPASAVVATPSSIESVLTFSIRRSNRNSKARITSLTIPPSNDYTVVRSNGMDAKERHFKALDFDDAELFTQIRRSYCELSGPLRFLSARSLRRIAVSGSATKAADAGYCWRSPRALARKGLNDTFSEEQILRHYRKPALGRSRYAFVRWAHRLAAVPARTPQGEGDVGEQTEGYSPSQAREQEGLEFVVSWSASRIGVALVLVLMASIAAALLWTFLGHNTVGSSPPHGGFKDSGDRLATAFLIGICILLIGLSSIVGWLSISWLLM